MQTNSPTPPEDGDEPTEEEVDRGIQVMEEELRRFASEYAKEFLNESNDLASSS